MKKSCESKEQQGFHNSLCRAVSEIGKSFRRAREDADDENCRPVLPPREAIPLLF